MKITIIIPPLDEEKYLPGLLSSLDGQRTEGVEIIVADGGSKDTTREIAGGFGATVVGEDAVQVVFLPKSIRMRYFNKLRQGGNCAALAGRTRIIVEKAKNTPRRRQQSRAFRVFKVPGECGLRGRYSRNV